MAGVYRCTACEAHFRATRLVCGFCGTPGIETDRDTCYGCGTSLEDSDHQQCPVCGDTDVERVPVADDR